MALAEGSGFRPAPPKPQVSYGAPSGPYAAPIDAMPQSPAPAFRGMPGRVAPGTLGTGSGNALTSFMGGVAKSFDPREMWAGMKVIGTGLRHPIMPGSEEWRKQMMVELAGLKAQAGSAEGAGGLASLLIPVAGAAKAPALAARFGRGAEELGGAARVASYPAGEVTNPQLLSRMGEHADLAEAVLANKDFDRHIAAAGRQNLLRRADDQGFTLGAMLRGEQAPHIQSPFTTSKTLSRTRRAGDPQPGPFQAPYNAMMERFNSEAGSVNPETLAKMSIGAAGVGGVGSPLVWNFMHGGSPFNLNNGFNYQRPDGTRPYGGR